MSYKDVDAEKSGRKMVHTQCHPSQDGCLPEIFTIESGSRMGHDNYGYCIPELLERNSSHITTTISDGKKNNNSSGHESQQHETSITTAIRQTSAPGAISSQDSNNHCSIVFRGAGGEVSESVVESTTDKMSPLPMHNRPLMGRRTALSVNVFIWIFFGLWLIVIEVGIFPHIKRGFFCDDRSINMRYTGDTISTGVLIMSIGFVYPILWLCEACYFVPVSLKSSRCIESAARAWGWFKEYLFGVVLHLFVVDGLKVLFGELRPHFFDTCRPDALDTCSAGQYVTNYECNNKIDSTWFVRDASKSFPSGHSSTSFYEAVFVIWYLQMRSPRIRSKLLIPTIQSIILLYALLCSVSRITDHRHHWWDVLAGAKIGILFASLTCIFLCKNFQTKKISSVEPILQNGNAIDHRHASVRHLLSQRTKDEVNVNHVVVP